MGMNVFILEITFVRKYAYAFLNFYFDFSRRHTIIMNRHWLSSLVFIFCVPEYKNLITCLISSDKDLLHHIDFNPLFFNNPSAHVRAH